MKKTIRIVIIIIAALLLCALVTGALVWLNYEGGYRSLGYGMIFRPYDLEGEDARQYKIDVYDLSGKIKTPTDNGDFDLGERTTTVSWEDTVEFILIDHEGEHDGLLEMLRSNYWEKLGSFKYDKVIVINDEIRYFVNTRKGVMYTYVVHNGTPIGWGVKPLTDRQIEILENGDTSVTDNVAVTEDILPDESEITNETTYDISRYVQSSEFLAVIYNDAPYYYSDNIYDPQELAYYLSLAEYVGQVESDADENPTVVEYFLEDGTPVYAELFPTENFQSNFLTIGTKLYILGDYMIAEFAEPWDNGRIVYGQVMMMPA